VSGPRSFSASLEHGVGGRRKVSTRSHALWLGKRMELAARRAEKERPNSKMERVGILLCRHTVLVVSLQYCIPSTSLLYDESFMIYEV
jgi:hypothetical protein